jgi:hypothetical protein
MRLQAFAEILIRIWRLWSLACCCLVAIHRIFGTSCRSHHLNPARRPDRNGLDEYAGWGLGHGHLSFASSQRIDCCAKKVYQSSILQRVSSLHNSPFPPVAHSRSNHIFAAPAYLNNYTPPTHFSWRKKMGLTRRPKRWSAIQQARSTRFKYVLSHCVN